MLDRLGISLRLELVAIRIGHRLEVGSVNLGDRFDDPCGVAPRFPIFQQVCLRGEAQHQEDVRMVKGKVGHRPRLRLTHLMRPSARFEVRILKGEVAIEIDATGGVLREFAVQIVISTIFGQ